MLFKLRIMGCFLTTTYVNALGGNCHSFEAAKVVRLGRGLASAFVYMVTCRDQ